MEAALSNPKLEVSLRKRMNAIYSVLKRVDKRKTNSIVIETDTDISETALLSSKSVVPSSRPPIAPKVKKSTMFKSLEIVWRYPCQGSCSVHGTFTEPAWIQPIKLTRDPTSGFYRADLTDLGLAPGTYIFKYVVDGEWKIDPSQPTHRDLNGHVNNSMFVRSSLRPLKSVRSAPAVETLPGSAESSRCGTPRVGSPVPCLGSESGLSLICGGWMIPHPEKTISGGADSFFYSSTAAGVADGVGEWEWRFKLDPRKFAEQLMKGCAATKPGAKDASLRALEVLSAGYDSAHAFGSSTACVLTMDESGSRVGIANLGDSGCVHFRKQFLTGALSMTSVMRTREQQHCFNMPYQLTRLPDPSQYDEIHQDPIYTELISALRTLTGRQLAKIDQPADADLYQTSVCEGDLLLLASDGVLDNLWNYDMLSIVGDAGVVSPLDARTHGLCSTDPEEIAKRVALAAFEKSCMESGYKSPFGVECRKRTGAVHMGGKMDDITVVVCWVAKAENAAHMREQINRNRAAGAPLKSDSTCRDWWKQQVGRARRTSADDVRRASKFEKDLFASIEPH